MTIRLSPFFSSEMPRNRNSRAHRARAVQIRVGPLQMSNSNATAAESLEASTKELPPQRKKKSTG